MDDTKTNNLNWIFSLRTQLTIGAIVLLGIALAGTTYVLIRNQSSVLTKNVQKTMILQGRNIALSSEKSLLRTDPEFELFPLVKRILNNNEMISSLVITDAQRIIQGATELQTVGEVWTLDSTGYSKQNPGLLEEEEQLYDNNEAFSLVTPVTSREQVIGYVYMVYSKQELSDSTRHAMVIILYCAAAAFILGIVLSMILFNHISKPMGLLMRGVRSLAAGDLNTRIEMKTRNEFHILAGAFNNMTSKLKNAQRELVDKEIMDKELEIAHDIQSTLIPSDIRQPKGYEIGIHYEAAKQVGGDYVDVIPVDESKVALVLADVSGKGIPGLVVMAMLKIMVHELVMHQSEPVQIIRILNRSLRKNIRKNMFVTMYLAILNTKNGEISYSNAGHNPLVFFDSEHNRCKMIKMSGPPLGVFPDDVFTAQTSNYQAVLKPDDILIQYTDGLTESVNGSGEMFGTERIVELCDRLRSKGAMQLIKELISAERIFRENEPQADDLTLLAVSAHSITDKAMSSIHQNERSS